MPHRCPFIHGSSSCHLSTSPSQVANSRTRFSIGIDTYCPASHRNHSDTSAHIRNHVNMMLQHVRTVKYNNTTARVQLTRAVSASRRFVHRTVAFKDEAETQSIEQKNAAAKARAALDRVSRNCYIATPSCSAAEAAATPSPLSAAWATTICH